MATRTRRTLDFDFAQSLGAAVISTARRIRLAMSARLEAEGVSYVQWSILALLARGDGIAQSEIADRAEIEPSSVSRALVEMEDRGWVRRRASTADRRCRHVFLARGSRATWKRLARLAHDVRAEALDGIPRRERDALLATLATVRRNLGAQMH